MKLCALKGINPRQLFASDEKGGVRAPMSLKQEVKDPLPNAWQQNECDGSSETTLKPGAPCQDLFNNVS